MAAGFRHLYRESYNYRGLQNLTTNQKIMLGVYYYSWSVCMCVYRQLVEQMLENDHDSTDLKQQDLFDSVQPKFGGVMRLPTRSQNKMEGSGGGCCYDSRSQAQT